MKLLTVNIIQTKSEGNPLPSLSEVLYVCDADWVNVMICVSASGEVKRQHKSHKKQNTAKNDDEEIENALKTQFSTCNLYFNPFSRVQQSKLVQAVFSWSLAAP